MLLRCWIFVGIVITLRAQTLTTLANFNGTNGSQPFGSVVQGTDGNFYGTTAFGGAHVSGTVFMVSPGGTLTTLYTFGSASGDGASPKAGLIQGKDGNFYGTTDGGIGTIFRISPSGTLTTLSSFSVGVDAAALIQAADGNFYGTVPYGGASHNGRIFKM